MNGCFQIGRRVLWLKLGLFVLAPNIGQADLPFIDKVEVQPLVAQVKRLIESMDSMGSPFDSKDRESLELAMAENKIENVSPAIQKILDQYCLIGLHLAPESQVKVTRGHAKAELMEHGWRSFLIKIHNETELSKVLRVTSPHARPLPNSPSEDVVHRWLDLRMYDHQTQLPGLSGLHLEYRIIQLYSLEPGNHEAKFIFNVGYEPQKSVPENELNVSFVCLPSKEVTFRILDEKGAPTTAAIVIRDKQGRVYPSQIKRLAPDFAFHPQVYRSDGENEKLPPGVYTVEFSRGPESLTKIETLLVGDEAKTVSYQVERWIDPSIFGWWSGDHHIHAAGCSHYASPTEGVLPSDMIRHCLGEDLKVGCNLTWAPGFDYQKKFFTGAIDENSRYPYLLRYDIEVSGFGSSSSGHLCLLRLKDQIYPGGNSKSHWPTLCLNTLKWAKKQNAVVGFAHSGMGLGVATTELPNEIIPPFDSIGANEYIVDVAHEVEGIDGKKVPAVDFIATVNTPYVWELNIWYHTLNCGFRTRISGETDFPCFYGERVGVGRSYVKLDGKLDFDQWCEGIRQGRSYVSDGKSHIMEFKVNSLSDEKKRIVVGEKGSELKLKSPEIISIDARVAALLNEEPDLEIKNKPYTQRPFWHIERARINETREVSVEVVMNGVPVATQKMIADGKIRDVHFDIPIKQSSWLVLRILPSSHTNPIFILVDDQPIRVSKKSAEWCLKGVDQCWSQKQKFIRAEEIEDAKQAYDEARQVYQKSLDESK